MARLNVPFSYLNILYPAFGAGGHRSLRRTLVLSNINQQMKVSKVKSEDAQML